MDRRTKSGFISTILEFYDFTVYAYLAHYIAPLYFPHKNALTSLLMIYLIFALGFFVRPIGAYLLGGLGDKLGRKVALLITLTLMVGATFLIGLLPTYKEVGVSAPILLMALRLIQGLSAGGEVAGSVVFGVESEKKQKCFSGALIWAGSGFGILLGSLVVLFLTLFFSNKEISLFAWRIPFLLALLTGLIGFYIRIKTDESFEFRLAKVSGLLVQNPWLKAIKNYKIRIGKIILLYALCASTTYLLFVFMPIFATKFVGVSSHQAMLSNTTCMLLMIVLVILVGYLSDKYSPELFLKLGAGLSLLLAYPIFQFILLGGFFHLLLGQVLFAITTALYQGPITAYAFLKTKTSMRYSVTALGYNISYSIFGGLSPFVATFVLKLLRAPVAVSFYLIVCSCLSLAGLIFSKKALD